MPVFLNKRQPHLVEYMDREDCDPKKLSNTYRQFSLINRLLSGWRTVYEKNIRPIMKESPRSYTLLDIGFGGGDIPLNMAKWAEEDGFDLKISAIELDERALEFALEQPQHQNVEFLMISAAELKKEGQRFDFVISNHVVHHLSTQQLLTLLEDAQRLCTHLVLFSDIERSDLGYALFSIFTRPLFFNSFIIADGKISIKRSFTKEELEAVVPPEWNVQRYALFRLLLTYTNNYAH